MKRNRWWSLFVKPGMPWMWVSITSYLVACALPAVNTGVSHTAMLGWECLLFYGFPWWWANPLYFVAILAYVKHFHRVSAVFSILSVLPALHFEGSAFLDGTGPLPGCVMWVVSLQLLALNAIWHTWVDYHDRIVSRIGKSIE